MGMRELWGALWKLSLGTRQARRLRAHSSGQKQIETLELRQVLSAAVPTIIPSIDGSGHNRAHVDWGQAGVDLLRIAPAEYGDGISTPGGADRPSAREISNAIVDQTATETNDRDMSNFVFAWGQFLDHDLDLTVGATPSEFFPIPVPTGDPFFDPNGTGTQVIPLSRANFNPLTGTSTANPRQQVNSITAWVDGSQVYGSDATTAASLRSFVGGRLKTSDGNLLPVAAGDEANTDAAFLAGDIRVNENIELTSVHTLFVREHNRIADGIAQKNPSLSDEQIYQQARLRVIAELQAITYIEFLPALLGQGALKPYRGYNPNVNPGIANEFSTAAFRIGHTLIDDTVGFLDNDGHATREAVALKDAFFNPSLVHDEGIDSILKFLASDNAQEVDTQIVDSLRNFLFGAPGQGGLDLASLNIQRGRDHGLADYNTTRVAYGLPAVKSFADITSDPALQQELADLYGSVDNIDLWIGGLAEDHVRGGSVGPTFSRIIADQFTRLRDGDRFWYQNLYSGRELREIENTHLSDIIRRNTSLTNLQENVFFFQTAITGKVFGDADRDGQFDRNEQGLGGRTVQLLDTLGNVVDTATTHRDGTFRFDDVELGRYTVRELLPAGAITTTQPQSVAITKGGVVSQVNLGEALQRGRGNGSPAATTPPASGSQSHSSSAQTSGPRSMAVMVLPASMVAEQNDSPLSGNRNSKPRR